MRCQDATPYASGNTPRCQWPLHDQCPGRDGSCPVRDGLFLGVERLFWQLPGVYSTAAGYTGGYTPNPTYREVCTGDTGHAEAVRIVYDPQVISYAQLLQVFWENHDPAQGMQQGNDHGTQYRSAIYPLTPEQDEAAKASLARFQAAMRDANDTRAITTEIAPAKPFYYAEDDHQQYLHKIRTATAVSEALASVCPTGIIAFITEVNN